MSRMNAGAFDRRITILRHVVAGEGETGEDVGPWKPLRTLWVRYEPVSGREGYGQDARFSEATARFTTRYSADILPTDRIDFEGQRMRIVYVQEITRRQGLVLFATGVLD